MTKNKNVVQVPISEENVSSFGELKAKYQGLEDTLINPFTKKEDKIIRVFGHTLQEILDELGTQEDLLGMLTSQTGYGIPTVYELINNEEDKKTLGFYLEAVLIDDVVILETDYEEDYVWVEGSKPIVFCYMEDDGSASQTRHIGFKQIIDYVNNERGK